jgi:endonuclease/exonuclease/phosphatase (EEP) superfamily protein YafD
VARPFLGAILWAVGVGAVVVSGALAAVRLGDPRSRRLLEVAAFMPLGLVLAVLGALTALVLLLVSARHRLAGLTFVAALVLAGSHTWWLAPLYVGSTAAATPSSFVVMSLNFEVGDPRDLAESALAHHVDVLVLLEMTQSRLDALRATGLDDRLPHVAGDDDADFVGTVVLSRFPLAHATTLYPGSDSLAVDADVTGLGRVRVVAVHTRPPYLPGPWRTDHERVRAALAGMHASRDASVLAGDFNATLAHVQMRHIVDLGFSDAADQVGSGWSPTWPAGGHVSRLGITVPPFAPIDHVLTSPALAVTAARTLEVAGADHRAVLASVSPSS